MKIGTKTTQWTMGMAIVCAGLGLMATGCDLGGSGDKGSAGQSLQPDETGPLSAFKPEELLAKGLAHPAPGAPVRLDDNSPESPFLAKTAAANVNITFSDPTALSKIHDVNSTFIFSPGYEQSIGNSVFLHV